MPKGEFDDAINKALDAQELLEHKAKAFDQIAELVDAPIFNLARFVVAVTKIVNETRS